MTELEIHQARLLVASIRRCLRKGKKRPEFAHREVDSAIGLCEVLVAGLR